MDKNISLQLTNWRWRLCINSVSITVRTCDRVCLDETKGEVTTNVIFQFSKNHSVPSKFHDHKAKVTEKAGGSQIEHEEFEGVCLLRHVSDLPAWYRSVNVPARKGSGV